MTTPGTSHDTVPTTFVEARGIRFAHRRFGGGSRVPVVFVQHFLGNLDNFDPALTDGLARDREVVLFDNAGVGASSGPGADTVEAMADDALAFLDALDVGPVDLLAHSMGGEVAQVMAVARPDLVRRLVLVGTGPRGGEGMAQQKPSTAALFARTYPRQDEMWLPIMFAPTPGSQAAGRAWLDRVRARPDRDAPVSAETAAAHRRAAGAWGQPVEGGYDHLREIRQPTLIVNGNDDIVIATVNSFILQQHIPDAYLVLYPDANHGSHFQYPELFLQHTRLFLDAN